MIGCRLRLKDYDMADYDLPNYDLQNLNLSLLKGVNFFQDKSIRLLKHRFDIFSQTSDKHFYFLSRSKNKKKFMEALLQHNITTKLQQHLPFF